MTRRTRDYPPNRGRDLRRSRSSGDDGSAALIARINALTSTARASWLGLISYLAFVGVTLLGVEDADFFIPDRQTELPLIGVSIPTVLFFVVAPTLGAALYAYFHLHLLKLWDALAQALPPPPEHRRRRWIWQRARSHLPSAKGKLLGPAADNPLGDRISPWLVTDLALSFREDAITQRPLRRIAFFATGILSFLSGPVVLAYFWWRSMPAHDEALTIVACGIPFFVSIITCISSWRQMRHRLLRLPELSWFEKRSRDVVAWLGFVALSVMGWLTTEGTLDHYMRVQYGPTDGAATMQDLIDPFRNEWWAGTPFPNLIVPANLSGVDFARFDTPLEPYATARAAFLRSWCARQTLDPFACRDLIEAHPSALDVIPLEVKRWCDTTVVVLGSSQLPCFRRMAEIRQSFGEDWQIERNRQLAAGNPVDLSGRDLRFARLDGANLSGATLRETRLDGATLQNATLERANLWGARMNGAFLVGARLQNADLDGTDLRNAIAFDAVFSDATLRYVLLHGANLWSADLSRALLAFPELDDSTQLQLANFDEAGLKGVDFDLFLVLEGEEEYYNLPLHELESFGFQVGRAFGDISTRLPGPLKAGQGPLAHWPDDFLNLDDMENPDEFVDRWRDWRLSGQRAIPVVIIE